MFCAKRKAAMHVLRIAQIRIRNIMPHIDLIDDRILRIAHSANKNSEAKHFIDLIDDNSEHNANACSAHSANKNSESKHCIDMIDDIAMRTRNVLLISAQCATNICECHYNQTHM